MHRLRLLLVLAFVMVLGASVARSEDGTGVFNDQDKKSNQSKTKAMTATASTGGRRPTGFTRSMKTQPAKPSRALSARRELETTPQQRRLPQPTGLRRARATQLSPVRAQQLGPSPKPHRLRTA